MLSNFTKKSEQEAIPVVTKPQPSSTPSVAAQKSNTASAQRSSMVGRPAERIPPSVIGPDLTIMGDLVSAGEVHVDGEVQGDLRGSHVVVGEKARVAGSIVAEEVVVRGHVVGSVRGNKVMLQSSSHIEGDIHHQSLSIEQGAFFEGKSRRADDPMADTPEPKQMPAKEILSQ